MSLTHSWRARIEAWLRALGQLTYQPLGAVPLQAHFTCEQLSPQQALERPFTPIAYGEKWGAKWQYAWFLGELTVQADQTERLVLHAGEPTPQFGGDIYGEWRFIINGQEVGSRDWAHQHIRLADNVQAGTRFEILAEAFGGPSRAGAGGGPALHGVPTIPEPPAQQRVLPEVTYGIWREEAFQLQMDARTLYELRDLLPADSLRVAEIDASLRDFTLIADPELPCWEQIRDTLIAARKRLRPLLECTNGSTAPTLFCVGHSHLDIVYQWPLKEAERKVARTFYNQLGLMEEYPEYRYLQSMPVLYEIAKRLYPELYTRIKEAIDQEQWIAEGAMWTEPDCNLPSGESLIRQNLYGKRFFREEFGIDSTLLWLPDTFGFSGALPQILNGCGITQFASSKIFCTFARDAETFPYSTFWWEGIDGSRILTHFFADYGIRTNPQEIARQWNDRPQKDGIRARMAVYGHSDGGGGCEREHLEFLRRQVDLEGQPRCRQATPAEFFAYQQAQPETLPTYTGEIYLPAHRGTYTTQAAIKKGNRQGEALLREAEFWCTAASRLTGADYPWESLELAWKNILFNQFHDILPGSCIERAAQEANALYSETLALLNAVVATATTALANATASEEPVLFNSLPWPRELVINAAALRAPAAEASLTEADKAQHPASGSQPSAVATQLASGSVLPETDDRLGSQNALCNTGSPLESNQWLRVRLPASGWTTLARATYTKGDPVLYETTPNGGFRLGNEHLQVCVNAHGEVTSWVDRASGRELALAPLNVFRMYRDQPYLCDAWEIEQHYTSQPIELDSASIQMECIIHEPQLVVLRIRRTLHHSQMEQEIRLNAGSRRVEFHTRIDWQESHKLLKVDFPLKIHATEVYSETQFGYIKRPTHRTTEADQQQFEIPQHRWSALAESGRGIALLNDCKYGISAEDSTLSLTLLRAPQAPDMSADIGTHTFAYALYTWEGSFDTSGVTRQAMELNTPLQATLAPTCSEQATVSTRAHNARASAQAALQHAGTTTGTTVLSESPTGEPVNTTYDLSDFDSDSLAATGEKLARAATLFSVDAPNIVIDTLKLAEDKSGDIVLRLYEATNADTCCILKTAIAFNKVFQTDMLEGNPTELDVHSGAVELKFRPFEIKTLRLS